jgi:hypothetical protein
VPLIRQHPNLALLDYVLENLRRSFIEWDRGERLLKALSYVFSLVIMLFPALLWSDGWSILMIAVPASAVMWALVLLVFVTPARMWSEVKRQAEDARRDIEHKISEQLKELNSLAESGREIEQWIRSHDSLNAPMIDYLQRWATDVTI